MTEEDRPKPHDRINYTQYYSPDGKSRVTTYYNENNEVVKEVNEEKITIGMDLAV